MASDGVLSIIEAHIELRLKQRKHQQSLESPVEGSISLLQVSPGYILPQKRARPTQLLGEEENDYSRRGMEIHLFQLSNC